MKTIYLSGAALVAALPTTQAHAAQVVRGVRVISDIALIEHRASGYEIKCGELRN